MKYSIGFRNAILLKVLPPENQPVAKVSQENGIAAQTIRNWMILAQNGTMSEAGCELSPSERSPEEKLRLVIEGRAMSDESLGGWLRDHGMHSEHLTLWEQELKTIVTDKSDKIKTELFELRKENKDLKKELTRKEKALAELATIMALKKKLDAHWEESEEGLSARK